MAEATNSWLQELNPQQYEAVTYGDGPLLVVAGAGTGKTKTLAYRVAYLISQGVFPERVLLLTFTRRAAEAMLRRAASIIATGSNATGRVWGGTFHAFANRILRIYAQTIGLPNDFTIIDRSDAEDLLDTIRNDLGLAKKQSRFPRKSTCLDIYSRRVNSNDDLEAILKQAFPWCEMWAEELKGLFRQYSAQKQRQSLLDYDDLMLYLYFSLQDEDIARDMGGRFDYVLVDEYQDTNRIQAGILAGLRRQNQNIMAVGDDAQSIYSFRSATIRNMLDFPQQFPGAKVIALEQNYRSTQPILETTNRIIVQARERYSKVLWSERQGHSRPQLITCGDEVQQDEQVIKLVLEHYEQGVPLHRQAVLFRAAAHSNSLEIALGRRNIPFHKYGGLRFLEAAHIKDLVCFLRVLENPKDEIAWFRILQLLSGIGPTTAAAVVEHLRENGFKYDALSSFIAPAAAQPELAELASLVVELGSPEGHSPGKQLDRIIAFYQPLMPRKYDNLAPREQDIEYLNSLADRYESRSQFLADLVLDPPAATGDMAGPPIKDEDWLVLSTIHSAKGLEWDVVYLIQAADGCLPSDKSTGTAEEIEEELRVTYVAMTRARDHLYVLWPQRMYNRPQGLSDKHSYAQRSRFLNDEVVKTMEQVLAVPPAGGKDPGLDGRRPRDIGKRIEDLWK